MSIREDAAKQHHEVLTGGLLLCTTTLELTDAHWQEAKQHGGSSEKEQQSYILAQTARGLYDACLCPQGASPKFLDEDTVYASCNGDPSELFDLERLTLTSAARAPSSSPRSSPGSPGDRGPRPDPRRSPHRRHRRTPASG